ncbi:aminopeptidase P family protein [Aurantimonas sp. MSK8Z-1]|uniref:aminopeptidase P family protein n=1 Tax=Mangrovibrevibacter kandeliae TaxID=2968473 RepID=UPI002118076D|nr:aminopeptidase P family protein [Aurantimonas sp. MSK8Z-1]MCW4114270.1 aminopeptidase P family protein [Aurantimonas sp. MSK8Z-1]
MFQSFESPGSSEHSARRVASLRDRFDSLAIDGFVVPRADEHQSEYVPASAARLAWITGFTGSAGVALVLRDRAVLFVDGRYTIQARQQVDGKVFSVESSVERPLPQFASEELKGLRIGLDPWLHTVGDVRKLREALEAEGGALIELPANTVDAIWNDRPAPPSAPVVVHPKHLAGRPASEKLAEICGVLERQGADLVVLTDPSSIAWTFNIRGGDVPHTPLPLSFAIVERGGGGRLFIDPRKLDDAARAHLETLVTLEEPEALERSLRTLAPGRKVSLDIGLTAARLAAVVTEAGGTVVEEADPARLPRARKTSAELAGARAAHRRDGAALATFFHWLSQQAPGTIGEIAAAERLEACRMEAGERDGVDLRDISFDTIAGSGPNGAIIHYRVTRDTDRLLGDGELFLLDSGAQYEDGTTDVTRTVAIGEPTAEMRRTFTLVLKGMIAISTARFPKGTRGLELDPLARIALWKAGLDFGHGTGHGVGAYLAVHEGPQSISRRGFHVLEPGMIVSNEPGYYREGAFGIRIENLLVVEDAAAIEGGDLPMHGFETLTYAPIDRQLIDLDLLTREERHWLDDYHARVADIVAPIVEADVAAWLREVTAPL